ncbi:major facilitator superfamily domain-containing protein [Hypomontagnella monticulosa]|nr:major facilitator superfamily domain-containing protein [Hypomontagnella monticulosa]
MAPKPQITLHDQEQLLPKPKLYLLVFVSGLIIGVANMDTNGISTILPAIASDLDAGNTIAWAGTASLIANTLFSVLYGRLSDIFGRKALFIITLVLFTVGELVCSFSSNGPMLYLFRAITGLSTGGIGNLTMIIISDVITLVDRGKYQGIIGSFQVLGNIIGPFIGAGFAMTLTWRGFFWLMAPLGAISIFGAAWVLPKTTPTDSFRVNVKKIDYLGALSYSAAIVLLLIPVSSGGSYYAWDSPMVISMLVISVILFGVFLLVEWKYAPLPMIPLSMFKTRDVSALFAQTFLVGWVYQTSTYFLPLYFQNLRGWSPLVSAALLTPITAVQVISSSASGTYITKTKRYGGVIHLGNICCLVGSGLMIILNEDTHPAAIVVILAIFGVGYGNSNQPMVVALQAHTPKDQRAVVISCRVFFRFLGGACGVAASSAILQGSLMGDLPEPFRYIANAAFSLPILTPESQGVVLPAYQQSIRNVFIANTAIMAFAMLGSFFWKDKGLESRPGDTVVQEGGDNSQQDDGVMQASSPMSEKSDETRVAQDEVSRPDSQKKEIVTPTQDTIPEITSVIIPETTTEITRTRSEPMPIRS